MNCVERFRDAICAAGIEPPDEIRPDGKIHRFATNGKRGDAAGWYVYHGDGIPAGAFGDWRTGTSETWRADIGRDLTPAEEVEHRAKVEAMRGERETEEAKRHTDARAKAAAIWQAAQPAPPDHPYLSHKGIKPHGARLHNGALVIPVRDGVALHSLQFIDEDGEKRFLTGGRVAGCYFDIGNPNDAQFLCIAEGFATAATIYEATGDPVAVAFNAGNLEPVARSMRAKFPDTTLIICSDDDVATDGNPGLTKATAAARAVGGKLAVPDFGADRSTGATDFNDMAALFGPAAVAHAIGAANFTSDYTTAPTEVRFNREVNAGELQRTAKETDEPVLTYLPLLGQDGYFVKGWSHILAAYPKSGKTELAVRFAGEWLEEQILYFSEEPESVWRARLRELPPRYNHVTLFYGLGLTQSDLLGRIRQGKETVVIIDTIRNLLGLRDEKDNSEVVRVLIPFIAACREAGKTLIAVHHERKGGGDHGEGITGGHAFLGSVDIALELKRDGKEECCRRLIRGWGRVNEIPPLLYELQDNGMVALGSPGKVALQEVQARAREVLTAEWLDTKAILDNLDAPKPSRDQLVKALEGLARAGAVDRDPPISAGKQQGKTYKWRAANFASDGSLLKAEVKLDGFQATGAGEWTQDF